MKKQNNKDFQIDNTENIDNIDKDLQNIEDKNEKFEQKNNRKKTKDLKNNSVELNNQENQQVAEKDEIDLKYENKTKVAKGGILGFFIGLAVIVPGVSGSAVAIIFKMYEKFLYAISNIFKKFKKCFKFLFPILVGAVAGFVIGFFGVRALLNILPFIIIALFAGLMFGAYPAVTDQIKGTKKTPKNITLFAVGLIIPILISLVSVFGNVAEQSLLNLKFYHYIIFLILGYLVAMTQLVPGLSATALLMSFGYFTPIMNSVSLTNFKENPSIFIVYIFLIIGFVIGLFTVSKGVSSLLDKHRVPTFYVISGLSLGSIVTMFFNPEVMEVYRSWTSVNLILRDVLIGISVFVIGMVLSYWFVKFERNIQNKKTN